MRTGRPLRFLVVVFGGWTCLRVVLLWPDELAVTAGVASPAVARTTIPSPAVRGAPPRTALGTGRDNLPVVVRREPERMAGGVVNLILFAGGTEEVVATNPSAPVQSVADQLVQGALPPPLRPSAERPVNRWSGSAWLIARPSGTGGGLGSSQLGGSQAGARLAYNVGDGRRVAVVGRVAAPLEDRGAEAALGLEWRPVNAPVRVFAEYRFALDGGRGGPSAGVIGGFDRRLPYGVRLEAYGQAGAIKRDRVEGFVDAAARLARPIARLGPATVDVGAGAWGAAQRGAERLDLGPTVGLAAPVGGRTVRLTIDWRERVAGDARPKSGPALSLGTDF